MKVNAGNIHEAEELTDEDFERIAVGEVCCSEECETLEKLDSDETVTLVEWFEGNRANAVDVADALARTLKRIYEAGVRYGRANP